MKKGSKKNLAGDFKKKLWIIGGAILLLLVVVGIVFALKKFVKNGVFEPYYEIEEKSDKIAQTTVGDAQAVGWLRVQGTDIDTPIVNYRNSLEQLLQEDYLWNSLEFIDGENRKVIYGHNIRNVSSYPDKVNPDHYRFEQLVSFAYYDFAKENLYIQYNDGEEEALYKIYAVSFNNSSDEYGQSYPQEDLAKYIEETKKNSVYDYDVDVQDDDALISLVTCTRYFGAYEKTQFRVDARRVRKNERIDKYHVERNSNYDIIQ